MALREELVIRTMSEEAYLGLLGGGRLLNEEGGYFLIADPTIVKGYKITEYTFVRNRMGMPSLTATMMAPMCIDDKWTGREYVIFKGEYYFIREIPASKKTNTDERYEYSLDFVCERYLLGQIYFFDVVNLDNATEYKPTTNSTTVRFYGTLREFVGRINCALAYAGLLDSGVRETPAADFANGLVDVNGDGYSASIANGTTYKVDECKELTVESQYIAKVLEEAYNVWEVPFEYRGRQIIFGAPDSVVDIPLAYGPDRELLTINKNRKDSLIINEITGKGSSENIPCYYPNETEYGHIVLNGNAHNTTLVDIGDFTLVEPALLTAKIRESSELTFRYISEPNAYIDGPVKLRDSEYYQDWTSYPIGVEVELPQEQLKDGVSTRLCPGELTIGVTKASVYSLYINASWRPVDSASWSQHEMVLEDLISQVVLYPLDTSFTGVHIDSVVDSYGRTAFNISFDAPGQYKIEFNVLLPNEDIVIRFDSAGCTNMIADQAYWEDSNGKRYTKLERLGIETDLTFGPQSAGDKFSWAGVDRIPFQTNLVVPKYRETEGGQRFYKALNGQTDDAYKDGNGNIYGFKYPWSPKWVSQYEYTNEDIKPTIEGIRNDITDPVSGLGQLFGEIADVAFDDNDNDCTKISTSDDDSNSAEYEHSFFYIRLHRLSYREGDNDYSLNLFKMASQEGEMTLQMTSGKCSGCKFKIQALEGTGDNAGEYLNPIQVFSDGDIMGGDYSSKVRKSNIIESQQDTSAESVWICVQKDTETFGVIMPNRSNDFLPQPGDRFNIINIRLPKCYILDAERRLEMAMMEYMYRNNEERWAFDVSMSKVYIAEHPEIEDAINENSSVQIEYGGKIWTQYVSSIEQTWKNDSPAPEIKLTLDDEVAANSSFVDKMVYNAIKMTKDESSNLTRRPWLTPVSMSESLSSSLSTSGSDTAKNVMVTCGKTDNYTLPALAASVSKSIDVYVCRDPNTFGHSLTLVPEDSTVLIGKNITDTSSASNANVSLGVGIYKLIGFRYGTSTIWNIVPQSNISSSED